MQSWSTCFLKEFMADYKPCPFCGSTKAFLIENKNSWLWLVSCYDCSVLGPLCPDKQTAIAWWNKRATIASEGEKPKPDLVDRYQREVEEDRRKLEAFNKSVNESLEKHNAKRPHHHHSPPSSDPFCL